MPSSSKKKKEKNVDFAKAKLKLGKGKKPANNAVDTSFKARSIAVPLQTIGQEKSSSNPTTRRNLTLEDLLVHLKHYNPNTRKDAIAGLRELLEEHPSLINSSLTAILHACARIISDEDTDVRKLLISFLAWLLRIPPLQHIRPHIQFLMLFITSAQTHIFPAIRIDAVRFIDVLLDRVPDLIVQNWLQPDSTGSRVLEGYLGLLNSSSKFWSGSQDNHPGTSNTSVTLSQHSQLVVLSSLATFLEKALLPSEIKRASVVPKWILTPYFPSEHEREAFCALVYPCRTDDQSLKTAVWEPVRGGIFVGPFGDYVHIAGNAHDVWLSPEEILELMQDSDDFSKENSRTISHPGSSRNTHNDPLVHLARTLQPILTTTWLDVAPSVFVSASSRTKNEVETQLAVTVLRIAGCLYGSIFRNVDISKSSKETVADDLFSLLNHISLYLPNVMETNDFELRELIRSMSFVYCELVSLTLTARTKLDNSTEATDAHKKRDRNLSVQLKRVGDYIGKVLDGELGLVLSTSAYLSLIPTLWYLLIHKTNNPSLLAITSACVTHAIHLPSKSGFKAASTQLIGIFALLYDFKNNPYLIDPTSTESALFREWYQQLPKTLWEVGTNDDNLTEIILLLLLRISQRRISIFDDNTHIAVISRFIPFFTVTHPQKGEIIGPFARLKSIQLRRLALDVAKMLVHDYGTAGSRLRAAVDRAVMETKDTTYWLSRAA